MASRTRRAKVALGVIALAVIGLGVWAWEPVYWWVTARDIPSEWIDIAHPLRGWRGYRKWGPEVLHGRCVYYYVETGFVARDAMYKHGNLVTKTSWRLDGTVQSQQRMIRTGSVQFKSSPPWWWSVQDQTSPSAPAWILDDEQWW